MLHNKLRVPQATNEKRRWAEVTDHGNELPEENAGCHKARQDKKWRNQKRVNLPETVVEVIRRRRLTWFAHVSRMSGDRLPTRALHCYISGRRSRGRPSKKWINNIQEDLNCLQLNIKEAMDIVRDRQKWRHRISTSSSPLGWRASKKTRRHTFTHLDTFSLNIQPWDESWKVNIGIENSMYFISQIVQYSSPKKRTICSSRCCSTRQSI